MAGECVPFALDLPPLEVMVDIARRDPAARVFPGTRGDALLLTSIREEFLALPIDRAVRSPFQLSHYQLANFIGPGKLLEGFEEGYLRPLTEALRSRGFTWDRMKPYFFISGPGCATNYHIDRSHVLAWQCHGTKVFSGLRDPDRWCPRDLRMRYETDAIRKPPELREKDVLTYEMKPGAVLWNCILTPHWVDATDQAALSINTSFRGLRRHGELCPHETELAAHLADNPERAGAAVPASY
jgi:hypothetical protein